jgi:hypothetical protein
MTREPHGFGSFGAPEPEPETKDDNVEQPTPVLHVGEVHADLVLHITDETLARLGSQLGTLIARATQAGFEHGLNAAIGETPEDPS